MEMMQLLALGAKLKGLSVNAPIGEFKEIFALLGIDNTVGKRLLSMIKLQASSPDQLFTEFMQGGGLVRVLSSPGTRVENPSDVLQCPHCQELIVL
jgi:hypothetical protein